jgi:hypothetical protein
LLFGDLTYPGTIHYPFSENSASQIYCVNHNAV